MEIGMNTSWFFLLTVRMTTRLTLWLSVEPEGGCRTILARVLKMACVRCVSLSIDSLVIIFPSAVIPFSDIKSWR